MEDPKKQEIDLTDDLIKVTDTLVATTSDKTVQAGDPPVFVMEPGPLSVAAISPKLGNWALEGDPTLEPMEVPEEDQLPDPADEVELMDLPEEPLPPTEEEPRSFSYPLSGIPWQPKADPVTVPKAGTPYRDHQGNLKIRK